MLCFEDLHIFYEFKSKNDIKMFKKHHLYHIYGLFTISDTINEYFEANAAEICLKTNAFNSSAHRHRLDTSACILFNDDSMMRKNNTIILKAIIKSKADT